MANWIFLGLGILALVAVFLLRNPLKQLSPVGIFLLSWGAVSVTGGLSLVLYNDLKLEILGMVLAHSAAFLVGAWLVPGKLFPAVQLPASAEQQRLPHQLLVFTRIVCVMILVAYAARYIHVVKIQGRVVTDVQLAYQMNQDANLTDGQRGSWFSRLGFMMFLWPLPASLLVWFYRSLSKFDLVLFGAASLGHTVYSTLQGGRSGTVYTLGFLVPLFLLGLFLTQGDSRQFFRRMRLVVLTFGFAAFVVILLMVMFGIRTTDRLTGRTYSEAFELSPLLRKAMDLAGGSSALTEGAAGAVGYATQPLQRLSLYTDLDINFRLLGAFNFDVPANLLRRVGIGEANFAHSTFQLQQEYMQSADAPIGTFSTCIRDYSLDFGWFGIVLGGLLVGHLNQRMFRNVTADHRVEYLPLLGILNCHVSLSGLFSSFTVSGANYSIIGAIVAFLILRRFFRAKVVGLRPTIQGGLPSAAAAGRPI